jgi:DNA-binding IclR family transcriptional regulator
MTRVHSVSRDSNGVGSVIKALRILETVGQFGTCSLADIAREVQLPKSTLHRLLATLCDEGYLERRGVAEYAVAVKVWRLGASAVDYGARHAEIAATLRSLVERTGETAHFSVYEDGSAVYVDKADGLHPVRAYTHVGGRSPAYASATGKALLAFQPAAEIARVSEHLETFSDATIADPDGLDVALDAVRRDGYAINRGEWREGVWGVAAPVFGPAGVLSGAVGLSGPRERIEPSLSDYSVIALTAATRLTERTGGQRPVELRWAA